VAAVNAAPDLLAELRRRFEGRGADSAPEEPTATATAQADGSIDGQLSVTADAAPGWKQPEQPDYLGMADQGTAPVVPEDNRSWMQRFEDSYNPALSPQGRIATAQGAAGEPDPAMFEWKVTDSGNEFQQYSAAQKQYLNSVGAPDAPTMLRQVYQNELQANAPKAPNPYAFIGKDGPDMKAYGESITSYTQGLQQAAGKAAQAVQAEKRKLFDLADKRGTQTNTSESHTMDTGSRRGNATLDGGVMVLRPVSAAEQERGLKAVNALQDLEAAGKIQGFEGAYQAAQAKARADGNVNIDTIIANLIAMGAVPSNQAIFLRKMMSDSPTMPMADALKHVEAAAGGAFLSDPSKRESWQAAAVKNVRQAAQANGYDYIGDAGQAAPAAPSPKPTAKDALKKEHAAKRAAKAAKGSVTKSGHPVQSF
jgi:hypothetical protein